ncbi:MAG TPA: hypothetical protein VFY99_09225 [Solirubrobacterales bacterium]
MTGTPPIPARDPAALATELRTSVTPVVGYLELLAESDGARIPEEQLRWIETIERRLGSIGELREELLAYCSSLRAVNSTAPASRRPAAERGLREPAAAPVRGGGAPRHGTPGRPGR